MVPAAARPSKPRRASNPDVDEVIHTGEIDVAKQAVPRSMVVRSSGSMPKIEVEEEETLITRPPRPPSMMPVAPRRRRSPLIWLVVGLVPLVAGTIAFVIMNDHKPAAATPRAATGGGGDSKRASLQVSADQITTTLDGAARAAMLRAESIAMAPTLRAGIMTDPATFQNQAKDGDTAYNLGKGESVEVFHIANGQREQWLRLPANAPALKAPAVGAKVRFAVRNGQAFTIARAQITEQSGTVSGELLLAVPIDLESVKKRVAEQATQASLVGLDDAPVLLVAGGAGTKVEIPVENEAKLSIKLEAVLR